MRAEQTRAYLIPKSESHQRSTGDILEIYYVAVNGMFWAQAYPAIPEVHR
jgi:hypothetical protein